MATTMNGASAHQLKSTLGTHPSATTTPLPPAPKRGLMLVHPRLKDPSLASTFKKWAHLHFRDLLNVPHPAGKITSISRFVAPDAHAKYSHSDNDKLGPYLITIHMDDIGIVQGKGYLEDVTRRLDVENTRGLGEDEERVFEEGEGEGRSVFEIVDAGFVIYEEVGNRVLETDIPTYQTLPIPRLKTLQSSTTTNAAPTSHLIAITLSTPTIQATQVLRLQTSVLDATSHLPSVRKTYTSVYKYAGDDAQPPGHPAVDYAPDSWFIVVLVEGEERGEIEARVDEVLGSWKEGEARWGVWGGEIFME